MKTAVVGGMIVGVHCVVIGAVILMGGCGRTGGAVGSEKAVGDVPSRAVMPPEEPVLTPLRVTPLPGDVGEVKAPSADLQKYVVKRGDMLSSIAQRHGVSVKELAKINNLSNPNKIKVGQELALPAGAKMRSVVPKTTPKSVVAGEGMQVYTVAKGDCLSKIAARFGTTSKAILTKNELTSDKLKVGQKLVVPAREEKASVETPAGEPTPPPAPAPDVTAPAPTTPAVEEPGATAPVSPDPAAVGAEKPVASTIQPFTHDVVAGETLQTIADKYNVPVDKLMSFNNLSSKDINPPLTLKIPQAN